MATQKNQAKPSVILEEMIGDYVEEFTGDLLMRAVSEIPRETHRTATVVKKAYEQKLVEQRAAKKKLWRYARDNKLYTSRTKLFNSIKKRTGGTN